MKKLYLKDTSVAERYDITRSSVWRWAQEEKLPRPVKLCNGSTRWRVEDLEAHEARLKITEHA